MADIKFSGFPKATTSKDTDELAILQDGVNKMIPSPVLESKIINKTVTRVISKGGASLNVVNLKGVVPTYADLATITPTPEINDAYQVEADGLVYVYTEDGFQNEGDGFKVQPEPIGVVEEGNDFAVSGGEVYDSTVTNESNRALPQGNEFYFIDRPDLGLDDAALSIVDEDGKLILRVEEQTVLLANEFDRPDLDFVAIDEDGYILVEIGGYNGGGDIDEREVEKIINRSELIPTFWEPPVQEAYNVGSANQAYWESYDYWGIFDEVRLNQKTAQGYSPYITRELLGKSTVEDYDVYRYEFKPVNPTKKALIFGGTHGSERISPIVLQRFFKALCEDWMNNPALMWARHNVHFVVIPLVSPFGFHKRNRRVWETDPFLASWTKSGNVVTVTFNVADFPLTNSNVSGSNYFTASDGIVGNTWISLINSSDQTGLPDNGYVIKSVINGQTVTIETPDTAGSTSGTCQIFVSTDPNRGFDLPLMRWEDVETSSALQSFTDPVAVPYNNKGTKPFALNETTYIADTYELHPDADFAVDMHNGAADYDSRYCGAVDIDTYAISVNNAMHVGFTNEEMPIRTIVTNTAGQYGAQMLGYDSFTIEWGEHNNITEEIATDSQRWMSNFILMSSRFLTSKNK